jgi:hypothetical protein
VSHLGTSPIERRVLGGSPNIRVADGIYQMHKTSPRQIRIQDEDEIRAFLAFCEASHLAINRDSIEKRLPPEPPGVGTDERSRNRFRSGLYAAARLDKVSVRGLPDGSVRVTKVGEWSSLRA